jgi:phosphatidylglycerophosphate synthase
MSDANRRPLNSRSTKWAAALTRYFASTGITPNQISMASMVAALIAFGAFWASAYTASHGARFALLILAAGFIQLRLLCNLLDGMVAIEAGKSAPDGPFWNEFPDRIADILILAGAGLAAHNLALGLAVSTFAVFTAYVREHGRACGLPADFSGPMAKPHRMAAMTFAALLEAVLPGDVGSVLLGALWAVLILTAFTVLRRAMRLVRGLRERTASDKPAGPADSA